MKFYTITAVSNFLRRPLISSFHYAMFHGLAERDGKVSPHQSAVWANTEPPFSPLLISRTIHRVPEICEPITNLVVSERLAQCLSSYSNIRLAQVVFKRLVDIDWQKGSVSWSEDWGEVEPRELLRVLPAVPSFHQQIGSLFEVQPYRLKDIVDRYPSAKEVTVEEDTPPFQENEVIRVSPEMLIDYPMLWWGSPIVNSDVFDILDAHLDRDFFIVRNYEVN
jgi:hypothetical protein